MEPGHINPFRKAGILLLVIGIIDIAVMIYCITSDIGYSSSFNIFAVIAGFFLLRGGVRTARLVRWFSIFLVVVFIGSILLGLTTTPASLLATQMRLNALSILGSSMLAVFVIGLLIWIYRQLSTPPSLQLLAQAGYKTGTPKSAYLVGLVLVVPLFGFTIMFLGGASAKKAKELAQEQLGSDYQYHVVSFSTSGGVTRANVTAYSATEIKKVQVQW